MKFHLSKLPESKRIQMISEFYDVISCLKNREEIRLFFKDLLTPDEIAMFMRRIEVAVLLLAGYTYEDIVEYLGVGKSKIANVQKTLDKGGQGYKLIMKRLLDLRRKKIDLHKRKTKALYSDFEKLKQRYPLHFLLFNLADQILEKLKDKKPKDKEIALFTPSNKRRL